jgi:hypothetical protein
MSAENQTPNAGTPAPADQKPTAETCDLRSLGASTGSADTLRMEWIATHVFGVEWFPRDDGMHETSVQWWAYDRDDRMETTHVGETAVEALRLATDEAMRHARNTPPTFQPNID